MRKIDLELRKIAARGDPDAAVELGLRYLYGAPSVPLNAKLALEYLRPHVARRKGLADLLATHVPLEHFIDGEPNGLLHRAAVAAGPVAMKKLLVWYALLGDERAADLWSELGAHTEQEQIAALRSVLSDPQLLDPEVVVQLLLPRSSNTRILRLALNACLNVVPESEALRRTILGVLREAEAGGPSLAPFRRESVTNWLVNQTDRSGYANYVLGCAQVDLHCGAITPKEIVSNPNFRKGYARLLRAAFAGTKRAWWALFIACSDHRSGLANQEAAELFLEQAAACGVVEAQAVLGARLIRRASNLAVSGQGLSWLVTAAENGHQAASNLLASLLPAGSEEPLQVGVLEKLAILDEGLCLRLRMSKAFGLTRDEALSIRLETALKPKYLILQDGPGARRLLPILGKQARELADEVRNRLLNDNHVLVAVNKERSRILDAFIHANGVKGEDYFASHRSGSFGSWRTENAAVLKALSTPVK